MCNSLFSAQACSRPQTYRQSIPRRTISEARMSFGTVYTAWSTTRGMVGRTAGLHSPMKYYQRSASNYRRPNYGGYYTAMMEVQVPHNRSAKDTQETKTDDRKSGVIFYSRLAGYPENRPTPDKAKMYAGVIVPPKPDEPLNCCQSGCVHCVWDIYREDIEDYQTKRDEAREALVKMGKAIPIELGGSGEQPDIIGQLDPSLQAFIKLEKALKQKRLDREQR